MPSKFLKGVLSVIIPQACWITLGKSFSFSMPHISFVCKMKIVILAFFVNHFEISYCIRCSNLSLHVIHSHLFCAHEREEWA